MIRRIGFIFLTALLLTGCGAKKKRSTAERDTSPSPRTESNGTTSKPRVTVAEGTGLYPMPEDPGRFEKFPIADTREYIETFSEIAQYEMRAFGIPASITLAQGILESGSGKGELTLKTNNHFGIKCHTGWEGAFDYHDDDAQGECFRKYNHPMFSFRDHSLFLTTRSRYAFLFDLEQDDYQGWARGLRQAGYATDRKYPEKLIALIERHGLQRFDAEVLATGRTAQGTPAKPLAPRGPQVHQVVKGDTLYAISRRYGISVEELRQLNGLQDNIISIGQVLQVKRAK